MDWIPGAAVAAGPWAVLVTVLLGVFFLFIRGTFVTGVQVDKTIKGYVDTNATLERELIYWRSAAERKDLTIDKQAEQLQQLMTYSALGTHALEALMKEAKKRGLGEAHD
jgi:hypothetical protein